ncbi:heparinase II/III domain-containing protein [Saccharopolyspora sp. NPDC002376]
MSEQSPFIESPPHVHPSRMVHVTYRGLVDALVDPPEIDPVTEPDALAVARVLDASARRSGRRLVPTVRDEVAAGLAPPGVAEAAAALTGTHDFTDRSRGRSALYGFHYLEWTRPLLRAAALAEDPAAARQWAEHWCDIFEQWYASREKVRGDWPGLDVVWYTLGVSLRSKLCLDALDTFGTDISPGTRCRVYATILASGRWLAEEHTYFRHGNWQFVGACALAILATVFDGFAESPAWLVVAHERIAEHLRIDVHRDGGHVERSPSYHRMCTDWLNRVASLDALPPSIAGVDARERLVAMHRWLVAMATPEGWVPPFQDSALVHIGRSTATAFVLTGDVELGQALARLPGGRDTLHRVASAWRRPEPSVADAPSATSATLVRLRDSGYVVGRSGSAPGDLYWAINAGPHVDHELESHSHRSALDVVLWGDGAPLVWEAGGPWSYDSPEYRSWYQHARSHSTVVLSRDIARDREATVDVTHEGRVIDVVTAHHHGWGARHQRVAALVRPSGSHDGYWVIEDTVDGDEQWMALIHGTTPWRPVDDGFAWESANNVVVCSLATRVDPVDGGPSTLPSLSPEGVPMPVQGRISTLVHYGGHDGVVTVVLPPSTERHRLDRARDQQSIVLTLPGDTVDTVTRGCWWRRQGGRLSAAAWWATGSRGSDAPLGADGKVVLAEAMCHGGEQAPVKIDVLAHGAGRVFTRLDRPGRTASLRRAGDTHAITVALGHDQCGRATVIVPSRGQWVLQIS